MTKVQVYNLKVGNLLYYRSSDGETYEAIIKSTGYVTRILFPLIKQEFDFHTNALIGDNDFLLGFINWDKELANLEKIEE